jgi:nitrite reductase/ring-hydroxylating ferredoxin subunit
MAPDLSLFDTGNPYYYLRIDRHSHFDRVIFGGNDHKTGQQTDTEVCYRRLEQTLLTILPAVTLEHRWSGQVIQTNDGLPFIGESTDRQFVATGFNGNGFTFATIAGVMARDAMLGRTNPWQDLFSIGRTKVRGGAWDYIKENVDFPYYYLADRVTAAKKQSVRTIKRGDGQILKLDGKRVACSRDEKGRLHKVSAVCPHMGCLVHWNGAEQTWDCPCHGSRFQATGEVLAGPAESPLASVEKPRKPRKTVKTRAET